MFEVSLSAGADGITAELVAWEGLLLQEKDALVLTGEIIGAGRTARAGADDGNIKQAVPS
jgi:hypothetical protein